MVNATAEWLVVRCIRMCSRCGHKTQSFGSDENSVRPNRLVIRSLALSCKSTKASQNQTDHLLDIPDQLIIEVTGDAGAGLIFSVNFFRHMLTAAELG